MSHRLFKRSSPAATTRSPTWAALALLLATPLAGQQTGQLVGRVLNGQSGEPMAEVQISVQGTGLGQITNSDGRFLILNVPVGERVVLAQLIGYSEGRQTLTVTAGSSTTVDFQLFPSAVELEGMVVTGTAIAANKREIGNSIDLITSDEITAAGAMNFEDLLRGRALGVSVTGTPGQAGAGSDILLRGTHSVNGRNAPLIYIDGVRMPSGTIEDDSGEAQANSTFLGDIRPEDIERIEIIKGAAASTLYGTDAQAGVIQIFTKRGAAGAPRWTLNIDQGFSQIGHVGPDIDPTGLHVNDCTRQLTYDPATEKYGIDPTPDPGCPASGSWLRDAYQQDYSLNVRGGGGDITYYASAGWGRDEGVVSPNNAENLNARGNFTFNGFENFQINFNSMYTRRDIRWIPNGDQSEGLLFNVARGADDETPDHDDSVVLDMDLTQVINHFNTSANVNWTPTDNFRHRLTVGLDYSNSNSTTYRPWLFWSRPEGTRTVDLEDRRVITLDYAGTWNRDLPSNFNSTFSFGAQYNQNEHLGNRTDVNTFIGPGTRLLENAENITNVNEDRDAVESGGFFFQEMLGWQNRLFITGGIRADTHSSFGDAYTADTRFTIYPRLQVAYTLSDYDFWPTSWFETFRLRAAYGESGEAPPATGSSTIWEAASLADENKLGFIIQNLANPKLGPERTKEFEGGMDASFLDGRLNLQLTGYHRKTYDGLIYVAPAPSDGIAENIPQNVGKWKSDGVEAGVDVVAFESPGNRVTLTANYQYNRTEMVELGDPQFDSFNFNYLNAYRRGKPIPSLYGRKLLNPDAVGELPQYTDADTLWYGASRPPHEISLGANLVLFDRFTIDAFGIGQYGHWLYDDMAQEMAVDGLWPACWPINEKVKAGDIADLKTKDIARCSEDYSDNEDWMQPADYFRLQTASISYRVPEEWLPGGLTAGTIQLRATNLFTITNFSGLYPDALISPAGQTARGNGYILPPAKTYTLNFRLNF